MPLDELYPPAQYGWGWLVLAFAIILTVIAVAIVVLILTRPRTLRRDPEDEAGELLATQVIAQMREEYLASVDHIEGAYHAGTLSARDANRQLSATVRRFVNEYSGLEAPVLSLADLRASGVHPALVDALERHYYPSVFRRDYVVDPAYGAEAARTVVQRWR